MKQCVACSDDLKKCNDRRAHALRKVLTQGQVVFEGRFLC